MASKEGRGRLEVLFLSAATGVLALVVISGFANNLDSEPNGNKGNPVTVDSIPTKLVATNQDCDLVELPRTSNKESIPYISVPEDEVPIIEAQIRNGDFSFIDDLKPPCGEISHLIISGATATATFEAPNYEQPNNEQPSISEVQAILDSKKVNEVFEVTITDGRRYRVSKMENGRLKVLELIGGKENIVSAKKSLYPSEVTEVK